MAYAGVTFGWGRENIRHFRPIVTAFCMRIAFFRGRNRRRGNAIIAVAVVAAASPHTTVAAYLSTRTDSTCARNRIPGVDGRSTFLILSQREIFGRFLRARQNRISRITPVVAPARLRRTVLRRLFEESCRRRSNRYRSVGLSHDRSSDTNARPARANRCGNCRPAIAMISGDTCRWPLPSTGPNLSDTIRLSCSTTVCVHESRVFYTI